MIQFGNPVKYGVIKKIETTAGHASEGLAEVEMVSQLLACTTNVVVYDCSNQ